MTKKGTNLKTPEHVLHFERLPEQSSLWREHVLLVKDGNKEAARVLILGHDPHAAIEVELGGLLLGGHPKED